MLPYAMRNISNTILSIHYGCGGRYKDLREKLFRRGFPRFFMSMVLCYDTVMIYSAMEVL